MNGIDLLQDMEMEEFMRQIGAVPHQPKMSKQLQLFMLRCRARNIHTIYITPSIGSVGK